MSKIAITPNASGTGTINIVAPNTNTDRTLTIPDVTGNVVTTGDTGSVTTGMLNSTLDLSSKTLTIPTVSVKPMFVNAYPSGLLTLTNDGFTLLQLNTQGLNNGLTWDTTNYRCTFDATTAGKYLIHIGISFYNSNNNFSECLLRVRRNGNNINEPLFMASGTGGGVRIAELRHFTGYATTTEGFSSGDYLDFEVLMQSSGSSQLQSRQYGTQATIIRIND